MSFEVFGTATGPCCASQRPMSTRAASPSKLLPRGRTRPSPRPSPKPGGRTMLVGQGEVGHERHLSLQPGLGHSTSPGGEIGLKRSLQGLWSPLLPGGAEHFLPGTAQRLPRGMMLETRSPRLLLRPRPRPFSRPPISSPGLSRIPGPRGPSRKGRTRTRRGAPTAPSEVGATPWTWVQPSRRLSRNGPSSTSQPRRPSLAASAISSASSSAAPKSAAPKRTNRAEAPRTLAKPLTPRALGKLSGPRWCLACPSSTSSRATARSRSTIGRSRLALSRALRSGCGPSGFGPRWWAPRSAQARPAPPRPSAGEGSGTWGWCWTKSPSLKTFPTATASSARTGGSSCPRRGRRHEARAGNQMGRLEARLEARLVTTRSK
mmetsp:Transcript_2032/g.4312  ORF Transcript_2032/g.4312 Transcript_2032/m.4312 type:complete len:376 (+) Transcript_2032:442-1569(+)